MNSAIVVGAKPEPEVSTCQRCGKQTVRERSAIISFRGRTMFFCEGCFRAVFKYDESLHSVAQIYEENGRKTPFTIRSNNWHHSSFMVVNEVRSTPAKNGTVKVVFVGDFYLRGVLKEQGHVVGKANHFIWSSWSAEQAEKYKEEMPPTTAEDGSPEM